MADRTEGRDETGGEPVYILAGMERMNSRRYSDTQEQIDSLTGIGKEGEMSRMRKKWMRFACLVMVLVFMLSYMPMMDAYATGTKEGEGTPKNTLMDPQEDVGGTSVKKSVSSGNGEESVKEIVSNDEAGEGKTGTLFTDNIDGAEEDEEKLPETVQAYLDAAKALWDSNDFNAEELAAALADIDQKYAALADEEKELPEVKAVFVSEDAQAYLKAVLALWETEDEKELSAAAETVKALYEKLTAEQKAASLVMAAQEALAALDGMTLAEVGETVYVDGNATADAADGTRQNPFVSLADAVSAARDGGTVCVLSDLTVDQFVNVWKKEVTIKSDGGSWKVTRGEIPARQDDARSTYNPAMIEVNGKLRLENIILDDGERTAGTRYEQATTDGKGGNGDTVQDAIIATYDGDGDQIILGSGAELRGYGGMSAVRLSGGTLTMENGSKITGGKNFTTKGGGKGPAGGVWIQGGSFTLNEGAEITGVTGRAVYLDGERSKATINGSISDIAANANMWQETAGVAMHVRNKSSVIVGSTGRITNIRGNSGGESAIYVNASNFTAEKASVISRTEKIQVAFIEWAGLDNDPYQVLLNGIVENCSYNDVLFRAFCARYTIGTDGVIKNTAATSLFSKIGVFYLLNAGQVDVRGKIVDNNNKGIYMANQSGGDTYVWIRDGAYIHKNSGYGIYGNNGGHVIMEGGEISENTGYGIYIRSKDSYPRGTLDMTGGRIVNNGGAGIYYETCGKNEKSYVNITGGEISGNRSNQVAVTGANATDDISRLYMKAGVVKETEGKPVTVSTSFGALTLDPNYQEVYFGNAKTAASSALKEAVKGYKTDADDTNTYQTIGSALWFRPSTSSLHFTVPRYFRVNKNMPLYMAYIPLRPDGTADSGAGPAVMKVGNTGTVDTTLTGLTAGQSYALMWMQPDEKYGTLSITRTKDVSEVLGQTAYEVGYEAVYTMPKDIAGYINANDELTVMIDLDSNLTYKEMSLQLESEIFALASPEPVVSGNTMAITLKLKEAGTSGGNGGTAKLTFHALISEFQSGTFKTDGKVTGKVGLPEGQTLFKVETAAPCITILNELPIYRISYTGGFVQVKEGARLSVSAEGGTLDREFPETVTEDLALMDPVHSGYGFTGWALTQSVGDDGIPEVRFAAQWSRNTALLVIRYVYADGTTAAPDYMGQMAIDSVYSVVSPEIDGYTADRAVVNGTMRESAQTIVVTYTANLDPGRPAGGGIGGGTGTGGGQAAAPAPTPVMPAPAAAGLPAAVPAVPAPVPAVSVPAAPAPPEAELPDEPVPEAEEPSEPEAEPETERLEDEQTPLADIGNISEERWALLNLLLALLTALMSVSLLVTYFTGKRGKEEEADEELMRKGRIRLLSLLSAILTVITFVLTEDISGPMGLADRWTILMLLYAAVNAGLMFLFSKIYEEMKNRI